MHIQVFKFHFKIFVRIFRQFKIIFSFFENSFDSFDTSTNFAFELEVFNQDHNKLFEEHYDNQIDLKALKVLEEKDVDKVTDVRVHELENVDFVDH